MNRLRPSRRLVLRGSSALTLSPAVGAAAKQEGQVLRHTSIDLTFAEEIAASFKQIFGGIEVRMERTGAEQDVSPLIPIRK